ncbi:MAG TPA: hypothetical protein DCE41_19080 [Cytophagales bacterium]|nr:hypothetical protein [Cytophagales bacterium]HAA19330.1 hypothetical protein [Cytophagales bacterium]HAP62912.1 hypothetical protein [Cytophagales bacterium]
MYMIFRYSQLSFLFLGLLLTSYSAYSQVVVKGKVVDVNNSPLAGNALLLQASDSVLVTGVLFLEGDFVLESTTNESLLLKLTSLDFADTIIQLPQQNQTDLGDIVVQQGLALDEVVVEASKPLYEAGRDGSMIVNVQETMLANSTSVTELLGKAPTVSVNEDAVSVFGKGEAILYLDGVQITSERFNSIPVNQIAKVEVITNPSARYDANGQAVINIILAKNGQEGLQGTIQQTTTVAQNFNDPISWNAPNYQAITLNYRKDKLSVTADYGVNLGRVWSQLESTRELNTSGGIVFSDIGLYENVDQTYDSNYRLGIGYDINDRSELSIQYDGGYEVYDLDVLNQNEMTFNGQSLGLEARNGGSSGIISNNLSGNYSLTLDDKGSSLFIGGQWGQYDNDLLDLLEEEITFSDGRITRATRRNDGGNVLNLLIGQVDYTKVFDGSGRLEIGAKYSSIDNQGGVELSYRPAGTDSFIVNDAYSNQYQYTENIPAFYAQYSGAFANGISYGVGVRAEYSQVRGENLLLDSVVIDSTYLNIFPNARLSGSLESGVSWSLSLSSRINRPRFVDLDPFLWYQDSLTSIRGNPRLRPTNTYSFEGTLGYKGYEFKVGYAIAQYPFRTVIIQGSTSPNSVVMTQDNLDRLNSYYATLTAPIEKGIWSSYNSAGIRLDQLLDQENETTQLRPQLYAFTYNSFLVAKVAKFELNGEYFGATDDGIYYRDPVFVLSAGASRSIGERINLNFLANDLLRTYRPGGTYRVGVADVTYNWLFNTYSYRLTVSYTFGGLKEVKYRNRDVGASETGRI